MKTINRRHQQVRPTETSTKEFNKETVVIDGYRYSLSQGSTTQTIVLSNIGKMLLGLSVVAVANGDISDTALTFSVNALNLTNGINIDNLAPGFVHAMPYFKLPQPLKGNDAIKANFNKTDAGTVTVYLNIFYLPRT